jgi:nicotinamide-nucleotide amidase
MGETTPTHTLTSEIVTTGTEILLGDTVDTNAAWIAQQLRDTGVNLYYKSTVGDNEPRLRALLEQALSRSDVTIVTGGLGPTVDDITRQAVANATRRPLLLDEGALKVLEERFARFGSKMTENNRQQAFIPEGATLIPNPVGTAPGFITETGRGTIIALPGVPREMKRMMEDTVIPWLHERAGAAVIRRRILRTMGIGESTIDSMLDDLMRQNNPTVGLAAHAGQADIRIAARADTDANADKKIDEVEAEIRRRLGQYIYSTTPGESYESYVAARLHKHGYTVSLLETNTQGAIATRLSGAIEGFDPVVAHFCTPGSDLPIPLERVLGDYRKPAEQTVRLAADALLRSTTANISVAVLGTVGKHEGIFGLTSGETWLAEADIESTKAARLPYGGGEEFTVIRIGNYALRMIDDGVTALSEDGLPGVNGK